MKIPQYIKKLLDQREQAAEKFNHCDYIISEWLDKNDIIVESCDYRGGVESIVNPYASKDRILKAIINK